MVDGITYGKGAAFLKQLVKLINFETFSKSLQKYISIYKWRNAELDDFVECVDWALGQVEEG